MQIHQLKRKHPRKKFVQIGRGGKRGKTGGRGTKGQKARAGHKIRPEIRDVIKRLPKLRGYRFKSIEVKPVVVNLREIEARFTQNEKVNPKSLAEKGVISRKDLQKPIKILSLGELSKKIEISGCQVSTGARTKIEKAGGVII